MAISISNLRNIIVTPFLICHLYEEPEVAMCQFLVQWKPYCVSCPTHSKTRISKLAEPKCMGMGSTKSARHNHIRWWAGLLLASFAAVTQDTATHSSLRHTGGQKLKPIRLYPVCASAEPSVSHFICQSGCFWVTAGFMLTPVNPTVRNHWCTFFAEMDDLTFLKTD